MYSLHIIPLPFLSRYLRPSKTPTSKFSECYEFSWEINARKSPIGSTHNHFGIAPTMIKVSLYLHRKY
ncbi:hypothetical protein DXB51_12605 [Bacillus cereus]|nr:hypothetical protein DXB51_12605 [Bacillus cereus]